MYRMPIISPYLFGRLLEHKTEGIESPIILPFGSISKSSIDSCDLFALMQDSKMVGLIGCDRLSGEDMHILPAYEEIVDIDIEDRLVKLRIWEVVNDLDKCKAYEIIMRSHYMSVPQKGMLIAVKFENQVDKEYLKNLSSENGKIDPWSKAWTDNDNDMIGCIAIDQLTYASPRGRIDIAYDAIPNRAEVSELMNQSRDNIISRLKIAWISRVAIDAPYRHYGIGTLLATKSAYIARDFRIPSAKYVETYITHPREVAKELLQQPNKCFFVKAGYKMYNALLGSRRLAFSDCNGNRTVLKPSHKLYLYRKTEADL